MLVYIYAADVYCEECGEAIREEIINEGFAPEYPDEERSYDSDEFPKGPYPSEEADCPQHCGAGYKCCNAIELSNGHKIGAWLENELTTIGVDYVRKATGEVATLWTDFYNLTMTTREKLTEMLTENTGRHFLDSGDYYGRHWQQNQGIDFENQSEGKLEFWNRKGELDIMPTIDLYHFLKERLEYNEGLDNQYLDFVEGEEFALDYHSALKFIESLDGRGIYGEDDPIVINTCNDEDLLSQIIQYVYWTDDDGAHVFLQIHGGCDARGGYTDPVAFDVTDYDGTSIFDNARAIIYCDDCNQHWDSDNGYNWCSEEGEDLKDYPATDEQPDYPEPKQKLFSFDWPEHLNFDVEVIWVDDEHNGHCPHCGGILQIAPWFVS